MSHLWRACWLSCWGAEANKKICTGVLNTLLALLRIHLNFSVNLPCHILICYTKEAAKLRLLMWQQMLRWCLWKFKNHGEYVFSYLQGSTSVLISENPSSFNIPFSDKKKRLPPHFLVNKAQDLYLSWTIYKPLVELFPCHWLFMLLILKLNLKTQIKMFMRYHYTSTYEF